MANKSITLESWINFEHDNGEPLNENQRQLIIQHHVKKYHKERIRENTRTCIEEFRAVKERSMHQITFDTFNRVARPFSFDARGRDIFRRSQEHRQEPDTDTESSVIKTKKNWF